MMSLRKLIWTTFAISAAFSFAYTTTVGLIVRSQTKGKEIQDIIKPDYKQIRARHIDSDITTSVAVYKDDAFEKGDTILTRYNTEERCLEVIYSNPESGLKVIVK